MTKRTRQYIGLLCAIVVYYIVHEGAHLVYALCSGVFRQINFMGLGIQIDIYAEDLTDSQLGFFCLVGAATTQIAAYCAIPLTDRICRSPSKPLRTCCYYSTIALLLLDPLYLSVLYGFFGGGDMNGIALLIPEFTARIGFGLLLIINAAVFGKIILPQYRKSFEE